MGKKHEGSSGLHSWMWLLMLTLVFAALWYYVFAITGLMWWNSPQAGYEVRQPPPPPIPLREIDTSGIDLKKEMEKLRPRSGPRF